MFHSVNSLLKKCCAFWKTCLKVFAILIPSWNNLKYFKVWLLDWIHHEKLILLQSGCLLELIWSISKTHRLNSFNKKPSFRCTIFSCKSLKYIEVSSLDWLHQQVFDFSLSYYSHEITWILSFFACMYFFLQTKLFAIRVPSWNFGVLSIGWLEQF